MTTSLLSNKIKNTIRDVPDFPKKGIVFKDITPILKDAKLCSEITDALKLQVEHLQIDVVAGVESRGFLFGMLLAQALQVPFVPIRKKGKLPFHTITKQYALEYGTAEIEIHTDAFEQGQNVLLHDDLLATGGTMQAACSLVQSTGANILACSFVVELDFLQGRQLIEPYTQNVFGLAVY